MSVLTQHAPARRVFRMEEMCSLPQDQNALSVAPFLSLKKIVVFSLIFLVLGLVDVWINMSVIDLGYKIENLMEERKGLQREQGELKAEIAAMKRPEKIEMVARERLGMRLPHADEVVIVKNK